MRFKLSLAALCAVGFAVSASAHHSHGQYDQAFTDIEGVVTELHLINPHSWLYIEVKNESGQPELWALEATGRGGLERIGVTREYIKPGDTIKARCHPLRDGTNGCLLGYLKAADGTVKNWDGGQAPELTDF
jgi:hypothetical protein